MGFKTACIFAGDCEHGYLGSLPPHHPDRCDYVLKSLGYSEFSKIETTTLEAGYYPSSDRLAIGVYEKAFFLSDMKVVPRYFEQGDKELVDRAMALYPEGKLLAVFLHSIVGFYGYSYYEKGALVRSLVSNVDEGGVAIDEGVVQPEEERVFEGSYIRDGVRYWTFEQKDIGYKTELTMDDYGEEFAFEMMTKFLKYAPCADVDESITPEFNLEIDLYSRKEPPASSKNRSADGSKPEKKSFWQKLFG